VNEQLTTGRDRAVTQKKTNRAPTARLLTLPEASEYLGLSRWKLRQLVHEGKLRIVRLSVTGEEKKWRLDRRDLDALVEQAKVML